MRKALPKKLHGVELDPTKFSAFEATLKRALSTPPTPHAPKPKRQHKPRKQPAQSQP